MNVLMIDVITINVKELGIFWRVLTNGIYFKILQSKRNIP
jgi:hypothetical protein